MSSRAAEWAVSNSFSHRDFPLEHVLAAKDASVSVCLPARDEERTIGTILDQLLPLREQRLIDQLVVVDNSSDATAEIARDLGVEVHDQQALAPECGALLGKGDAMWRALRALDGEIVVFLDADSEDLGPHFVTGLLGPLFTRPQVALVKAHYRRPFRVAGLTLPEGGGRVTELTARPLLELFYPDLVEVRQPLAGEIAARRTLLERLPFAGGYGVEMGLLIDAYRAVGLSGIAQVDLDVRQNAHQPLHDLRPMAAAVLQAVAERLVQDGRLAPSEPGVLTAARPFERPPLASLRAAA